MRSLILRWSNSLVPHIRLAVPAIWVCGTLVGLYAAVLFFWRLEDRGLWASHEARAAQHAQRMLDSGDWGLPTLYDGQVDLQKPPGYYWLVALCSLPNQATVTAWTVRLPAALAGLGCVLLVFTTLVQRQRLLAAVIASLVLATMVRFTGMARVARIDMCLTLAISVAIVCLASPTGKRLRQQLLQMLGWVALAAAVLLKGPIGLILPGVVLALYRVVTGFPRLVGWSWLLGPLVLIALAVPWFWWANLVTEGALVKTFLWQHNLQRALGGSTTLAGYPWWYYVPRLLVDALPWTPVAAYLGWKAWQRPADTVDRDALLGLIWWVSMLVVLSCMHFKRADYLLPLYPGLALWLGCLAERCYLHMSPSWQRLGRRGLATVALMVLLGWWGYDRWLVPQLEAPRQQRRFAVAIRQQVPVPEVVHFFRVEEHLLAYHLGRPIHTLVEWPDLLLALAGPGPHWLLVSEPTLAELQATLPSLQIRQVLRNIDYLAAEPDEPLVLIAAKFGS